MGNYNVVERGSSVVERRARNQVSPGSNPPLLPFRKLGIFVLSIDAPVEYLAIDSGGSVSDLVFARNCVIAALLECFPEKPSWCRNEQVGQGRKKV